MLRGGVLRMSGEGETDDRDGCAAEEHVVVIWSCR